MMHSRPVFALIPPSTHISVVSGIICFNSAIFSNCDWMNCCPELPGLTLITITISIISRQYFKQSIEVAGFSATPDNFPIFLMLPSVL